MPITAFFIGSSSNRQKQRTRRVPTRGGTHGAPSLPVGSTEGQEGKMFRHMLVLGSCVALLSCAGSSSQHATKSAAHEDAKAAGGEPTATHTAKAPAEPVQESEPSAAKASVLQQGN